MPTLVVVGAQWGDEGKGKVADFLAAQADVVVRYQGGPNTGHTVIVAGREFKLHLVPSGIVHGKTCVMGNGMVLDIEAFFSEMAELRRQGCDTRAIWVSDAAQLILPYHLELDAAEEAQRGEAKIGTTLRGVGPAYRDKAARTGLRVGDLLHEETFRSRLRANLEQTNAVLRKVHGARGFDAEELGTRLLGYAAELRPQVTDTVRLVNERIDRGERVLFEGAQGTMLDLDHGTYPFVSSSNATAGGACIGAGVGPSRIDQVIGVAKAYTTRVGEGPMPSEIEGPEAERLREQGHEYGVTTGRPRRCGWFDVPVLRYAALVNGLHGVALTKLDTLSGLDPVRLCVAYERNGRRIDLPPHDAVSLAECRPVYEDLPGWQGDLSSATGWEDLPANARAYVERIEAAVGVPVVLISVGAERTQTMQRRPLF
jgi:adenylosuccinate synthase